MADFAFGPAESWLKATPERMACVIFYDGRFDVELREGGRLAGFATGASIAEATANALNDAMIRAHEKEEGKSGGA